MSACRSCGTELPGRRWKCDACKAGIVRPRLGDRGTRLYDALTTKDSDETLVVLATEAARIADRLDELDRIIAGKGVLELMRFRVLGEYETDDGQHLTVEVKFDSVLSESRQQAGTLHKLLTTSDFKPATAAEPGASSGGSPLDAVVRLAQERANRRPAG